MKKQNLILQTAVAAALASASIVAEASSIGRSGPAVAIGAYGGSYTIASESFGAAYPVDLNAAVATGNGNAPPTGFIRWIPTFGLNSGDVCTFTFTKALYTALDVKLLGEEAIAQQPNSGGAGIDINADGDITDVVEVASNFGVTSAAGVATVQVRINNAVVTPTGINLVLAKNSTGANAAGVLTSETQNITLVLPVGTTPGPVTIASSCTTSGGLAIGAAIASNTIIDIAPQFSVTLTTPATSVIDVAAIAGPRLNFVDETAGAGVRLTAFDTSLTQSAALYTFSNGVATTIEDPITPVAGDTLVFTLTSSTDLTAVATAGALDSFVDGGAAATGTAANTAFEFTPAGAVLTSAAIPGTAFPALATAVSDDIIVGVNSTTIVTDRTFSGSAKIDFLSGAKTDVTFPLGTTHTWTTNGTILQAPIFHKQSSTTAIFVLTNTSTTPAPFTIAIQAEAGNTPTAGTVTGGTIPATGTLVIQAADIVGTFPGLGRATAIFTVNAPTTAIQGLYRFVIPNVAVDSFAMIRPGTN